MFGPTDARMFIVAVSPSTGQRMIYELMNGATIAVEYEYPEPPLWGAPIAYAPPMPPPRVTVEGKLLQGRFWKEGETFTPTPQGELDQSRQQLAP